MASQTKWTQQQALEQAQRQAMLDALAQEAQAAAGKDRAEGNALQRIGLQQRAADADMDRKDADLNRKNALEIERIRAKSRTRDDDGKTLPASVANPIFENRRNLTTIRRARQAIVQRPDAFGLQNAMPGFDYIDSPENVAARAPVANLGSLVIHDRSGAAVTISEFPRLRPFIPNSKDSPAKAAAKLEELEREIRSITDDMATYYAEQGFAIPGNDQPTAPTPEARTAGAGKIMSTRAYEAAKAAGYSDTEIRAEGWEIQP